MTAQRSMIDKLTDLDSMSCLGESELYRLYELIAADKETSLKFKTKCEAIFNLWQHSKVSPEVVNRFRDLWLLIEGSDYPLEGFERYNLVVEEIDVSEYLESRKRKSLRNLILEEVEVTDYV